MPVLWLLLAAMLLWPHPAQAGSISLETTLKVDVGDAVRVTITVRNRGNDTAGDVTPKLRFGDAVRGAKLADRMGPGSTHEWSVEFPKPDRPGRYPLLSTVSYTDPGFRGFSAVSATLVDIGGVFPARIRGTVSKISLDGDGTLEVTVQSDDAQARSIQMSTLLPDELGGIADLGRAQVTRGQPRSFRVPIQNHGALPGSHYPVYAVARASDGDHETAALLLGSVDVAAASAIDWETYLPGTAVGLTVIFLAAEIMQRMRGRSPGRETPLRRT